MWDWLKTLPSAIVDLVRSLRQPPDPGPPPRSGEQDKIDEKWRKRDKEDTK